MESIDIWISAAYNEKPSSGAMGGATSCPLLNPDDLAMNPIQQEIEQNELVKRLLEAIGDGVFVLDPHGRIVAWNPAMETITGYTFEEIKGKHCSILKFNQCFGRDRPTGIKDCGILKTGKVVPAECLINHKRGQSGMPHGA